MIVADWPDADGDGVTVGVVVFFIVGNFLKIVDERQSRRCELRQLLLCQYTALPILLAELDRVIDQMVEGKTERSPWESLVSSYLTVFSRDFLFRYFDDEGIVKKGKKLSYKELAATLTPAGVASGSNE